MCKSLTFIACCVVSLPGALQAMTTPLHRAVEAGDVALVQELLQLQSDVDINTQDKDGYTALHLAAIYDKFEIAQLLLTHPQCNVNAQNDNNGCTALHLAAANNGVEIVQLLIAHRCNVNTQDNHGYTALHLAVTNDKFEVAQLLLAHPQCDVNAQNKFNETALHRTACVGNFEIAKLLIAQPQCNVNAQDHNGLTALHWAAYGGKFEIVKLLLAYQHDVNAQDHNGCTALHYAVYGGKFEIVKLLLAYQRDVNLEGKDGKTALMIAQEFHYAEIVSLITHWQLFVKGLRTSLRQSFLAATHPRCGQNSPISKILSQDMLKDIAQCVLPPRHCTYTDNEIEYYVGLAQKNEKNNSSVERKRKCSPDTTGQAKFQKRADR
jgi:ankyrin repeat protein